MDNKLVPYILQHVRELAEAQMSPGLKTNSKIITPFPPDLNDFPGFALSDLEFADPETDADIKKNDTWNANNFFISTDSLYYDFSYGLKAPEYSLSQVCAHFLAGAQFTETATDTFKAGFQEMKNAFERYGRSTIGDLGTIDFYYTFPSPIRWYPRIKLTGAEVDRMKAKAIEVYSALEQTAFLDALIKEINATAYTGIEYDLGYFDVNRRWINSSLFDAGGWTLARGDDALYGAGDQDFSEGNAKLCYAQRFYVMKEYTGVEKPSTPVPVLRPTIRVHDRRTVLRNTQLFKRIPTVLTHTITTQPARAGYIWVKDHWERARAIGPKPATPVVEPPVPVYKVVAVVARNIPWKPPGS
jgi:hypothetical protein